jgi:hypothetical protein
MVTTRIDMAEHCKTAFRAIQRHQSQLPSIGALAEMPEDAAASVLAMQGIYIFEHRSSPRRRKVLMRVLSVE